MPTKPKIQDQTFLFTGTLTEFTRDEAEALVEANGGKVLSGVSAKLNFLVVGEDAGSKLAKAKALKTVSIITEKEFLKMVPKENAAASNKIAKEKTKPVVTKASAKKVASETTIEEVKIGKQIWMAKNLDVAHFRNVDPIPEAKTDKEWQNAGEKKQPAWCYYKNDAKNGKKYGKLYNWYAVNDPRILAPERWCIPSDSDWRNMLDYLGGEDVVGEVIRNENGWDENSNGTNESGFSGLPGGFRAGELGDSLEKLFNDEGFSGNWWSSSEYGPNEAWLRSINIYVHYAKVFRYYFEKSNGYSVRCILDSE